MSPFLRWGFWRKTDPLVAINALRNEVFHLLVDHQEQIDDLIRAGEETPPKALAKTVNALAKQFEEHRAKRKRAKSTADLDLLGKSIIRLSEKHDKLRAEVKESQAAVDRRLTAIDSKGSMA